MWIRYFREGSTLVREQEGLRLDIFRSFTSAKDTQGAIKALHRYGPDEPQRLDHLQWGEDAVLIDVLQDCV
jgi:hypothetical protein